MKLFLLIFGREVKHRTKILLAYTLTMFIVMFALYAQITFQESANARDPIEYMMTPTYAIVIGAFSLIGLLTSRTFIGLYRDSRRADDGILLALGVKRRTLAAMLTAVSSVCFTIAAIASLPFALLFIKLFVAYCSHGDMDAAGFTPLVYAVPFGNLLIVTVILFSVSMLGTLSCLYDKSPIIAMIRGGSGITAPENGAGELKEKGSLANYGRLYVRRSVRRCLRYNAVAAFLLILPMIYLLGSSTFTQDTADHDFTIHGRFNPELGWFEISMTKEMVEEVSGLLNGAEIIPTGVYTSDAFDEHGYHIFNITLNDNMSHDDAYGILADYTELYDLDLEDSYAKRTLRNHINAAYNLFFMFMSLVLFIAGGAISVSMLDSRLNTRKRELSLLRSLGVKLKDIHSAVLPETVIDSTGGAVLSIILGALGFMAMVSDGGGYSDVKAVIVIACIFLVFNIFLNIFISKRLTIHMLSLSDNQLRKETVQ